MNGIKDEVYNRDIYNFKKTKFERNPKFIIDIGANVGWFSKLAAEHFSTTNILAYELVEKNYKNCVELNRPHPNVHAYNKAVIGNNDIVSIFLHSHNEGGHKPLFKGNSSYISEERFDSDNKNIITDLPPQISFERIIKKHQVDYIDFLKVDCEGSEYEIFPPIFESGIDSKILNLAMEIHGVNTPEYLWLTMILNDKFDYYKREGQIIYCKNYIKKEDI